MRGGGVGVPEGQGEGQLPVASEDDHGELVAHAAALQGRVVVAHRVDILPIDGKKQVARLEAVGIGGHFIDIDTSAADAVLHSGGLVSQVNGGEASIHAAGDIALADKLFDDGLGGVYRDGEAQAFHAFLGVFRVDDADKLPIAVEQAAAGVAGVDGRVGLQQGHGLIIDGDFPAQGADDAAGDGAAQLAQGVADGNGGFAHDQVVGAAQHRGGQAAGLDFENGQVGIGIGAHQIGGVGLTVPGAHGDAVRAGDNVIVGDDIAVGRQDDAAARALADPLTAVKAARHGFGVDFHHRIGSFGGHLSHRETALIGVVGDRLIENGLAARGAGGRGGTVQPAGEITAAEAAAQ